VEGNPVNWVDSRGTSPACPLGGEACARQRLFEIIFAETKNNGALALARTFEDKELYDVWGNVAGRTSARRLEWLLDTTRDYPGIPTHFAFDFGSDCGFREEFQDSQFYPIWYPGQGRVSNQVGHFLTAVSITYNYWNIGLIIGHEKVPDSDTFENFTSYIFVTDREFKMFYDAAKYDEQGEHEKRDDLLWRILNFDPDVPYEDVSEIRDGNSLQDLRLSLKDYRLAK